ncbi:hypothetical protein [uncultured Paludibaculum sp.]|uniref:Vgb family protein n=1 Tax=uncultured Paludibaculum sp. TaxID=1765020 RepID=UPI002AAA7F56|nr:hypothetical protein [uncultured Paludibaculum sp.]
MHLSVSLSICLLLAPAAEPWGKEKPPAPPKTGVKTPGVQIPFANLKSEAEIPVAGLSGTPVFTMMAFAPQRAAGTLQRIDAKTNKPGETVTGLDQPCGQAVSAFRSLWVPGCGKQVLQRVDARSGKVSATLATGLGSDGSVIAASEDSIWVLANPKTDLVRIDPQDNHVVSEMRLPAGCSALLPAEGAIWIACPQQGKVLRLDPKTQVVVNRIETAPEPVAMASGAGSIWVLCKKDGKISRIDPKTNKVTATVETGVPNADGSLEFGEGSVWVSVPGFPVARISPETDKVVQQFAGAGGGLLKFGLGSLWLADVKAGKLLRIDPKRVLATLAD